MRLTDLLARYPTARLATPADNAAILELFERTPMQTSAFAVQYRRRPDFFRLLRYQSDRSFVLVGQDDDGTVGSVGTVSLRPGWVHGQPTTVGYLGDLRIALDRFVSRAWRQLFTDLVMHSREIEELADCTHWFTVVMDGNHAARSALATTHRSGVNGRRAARPEVPSLVPIAPFTMRNLIMRLPLARWSRGDGRWSVRDARAEDRVALTTFFEDENRCLPLGFRGELDRRMSCWDGLSITDFVYAADEHGIVGCVAPWSAALAKQTVVSRIPAAIRLIGRGARVLPAPPVRVPEPGEPLRTSYLTHLTFASRLGADARRDVFRAMLHRVFDGARVADWHCVALCDFNAWNLGRALTGFIEHTVPITVYSVVPAGNTAAMAATDGACPPAFEMAMV
jgi:hypothetical protein